MKSRHLILAIVAMVFAANILATNPPNLKVVPVSSNKVLVTVSNSSPEKQKISLTSRTGKAVYFKSEIEQDKFKRIWDLSELEDGLYQAKVESKNSNATCDLEIINGEVKVNEVKMELDPVFSFSDNRLNVSYFNYEQEKVRLTIYQGRDILYESGLGNDLVLHEAYNFSQLNKGDYDIKLANADEQYWYTVSK